MDFTVKVGMSVLLQSSNKSTIDGFKRTLEEHGVRVSTARRENLADFLAGNQQKAHMLRTDSDWRTVFRILATEDGRESDERNKSA